MKTKLCLLFFLPFVINCFGQQRDYSLLSPSDTLNLSRRNQVLISEATTLTGGTLLMKQTWYNDKKTAKFHFVKDQYGWGLMDKAAHGFATYQLTRFSNDAFLWSGASKNKSLLMAGFFGLGSGTAKEILDGFTQDWGWSWADYSFNVIGSGLYIGQEIFWNEQRIQPKFSYNNNKSKGVITENIGENYAERLLKNYDGQTFWLSFNVNSFAKTNYIPNWLNFSVGYGVDGYINDNKLDIAPQKSKSIYLSLDADLTKINTKSHFLKTIFSICNTIKIPAPTIEFSSNKSSKLHFLYF